MENNRELALRMADAEQDAIDAVNHIIQKHNLPCFLFEPILWKVYRQLSDMKASEIQGAKQREQVQRGSAQTQADNDQ